MSFRERNYVWCCAVCICLHGCFSVNPDLITEDEEDAGSEGSRDAEPSESPTEPDGGEPDAEEPPEIDARVVLDARVDAQGPDDRDDGDSGRGPTAPRACVADSECDDDQFCSGEGKRCTPRCTQELGCAQPAWSFESGIDFSLIADAQRVYWGSARTMDGAGNLRDDSKIWSWDLKTPPLVVATNVCGYPYLVVDDYVYCHIEMGRSGLARVRKDGSGGAETLITGGVVTAWSTEQHVWWSRDQEMPVKLYRLARTGGALPEQVPIADRPGAIIAGNASSIFRLGLSPDDQLGVESLADASQFAVIAKAECFPYMRYAVDAHAVYCVTWEGLKRIPTDGSGAPKFLYRSPDFHFGGDVQLVGEFAHWSFGNGRSAVAFGRTHKLLQSDPELLATVEGAGNSPAGFGESAWLNDQLVYFSKREGRLFVKSFASAP